MILVIYSVKGHTPGKCEGRMRVSREKAAENRERIVETASRMFREAGFDGVLPTSTARRRCGPVVFN